MQKVIEKEIKLLMCQIMHCTHKFPSSQLLSYYARIMFEQALTVATYYLAGVFITRKPIIDKFA